MILSVKYIYGYIKNIYLTFNKIKFNLDFFYFKLLKTTLFLLPKLLNFQWRGTFRYFEVLRILLVAYKSIFI